MIGVAIHPSSFHDQNHQFGMNDAAAAADIPGVSLATLDIDSADLFAARQIYHEVYPKTIRRRYHWHLSASMMKTV